MWTLPKSLTRISPPPQKKKLELLTEDDLGMSKGLPTILPPPSEFELLMDDLGAGVWRLIAVSPEEIPSRWFLLCL